MFDYTDTSVVGTTAPATTSGGFWGSLSGILNTVSNVGTAITGGASQLAPLASSMSNALKSLGYTPPTELTALTNMFHQVVVRPNQQVTGASPVSDVINYFGSMYNALQTGQQLNPTQQIVANGAGQQINGLQISLPIIAIIAGVVILIVLLLKK